MRTAPPHAALWWDLLPARERLPEPDPVSGELTAGTCVIGGGVAGASVALALARRGDDVLLVDRDPPGWGASGRNAGFLLADSDCVAMAAAQVGDDAALLLREMGLATRRFVRSVGAAVEWTGSVRLATDAREAAWFDATAQRGFDGVRTAPSAKVPERGGLVARAAALVDEGDGMANPLRVLFAILVELGRTGARVRYGTPVTAVLERRGAVIVETTGGRIAARRVVVATNSEARSLLGSEIAPIRPVRAQALAAYVDPMPPWRRPCYATRGGDYWRPVGRDRALLGGLRRLGRRTEATRSADIGGPIQDELARLLRVLVGRDARIEITHRWAGTMGFTRNALPQVGAVPLRPRTFVLAGWNGHGMGWAPGFADALAAHLQGDGREPHACFRPVPALASASTPRRRR